MLHVNSKSRPGAQELYMLFNVLVDAGSMLGNDNPFFLKIFQPSLNDDGSDPESINTIAWVYQLSTSNVRGTSQSNQSPILDEFMMPYDKNEQFIGRRDLLQSLKHMLCETVENQWNHRIALYGMGGVGKT